MISDIDEEMMMRALKLSLQGRISAPPNPWVGSVIVNNNQIVGEGFHYKAGEPHAEIHALSQAQEKAKGATVYVTLEPCSHYGRTPPCVEALVRAQVSRVVFGVCDPDLRVSGKGASYLKNSGIEVKYGVLEEQINHSLAPYLFQRKTGLAYCIGKAAISIDGRIAAQDGSSQWISSPEAISDAHQLRAESQAIIISAKTAILDKPKLTVRHGQIPHKQPLRVVIDAQGVLAPPHPLFDQSQANTLIMTSAKCAEKVERVWSEHGIETMIVPELPNEQRKIDLSYVLKFLGQRGILQVLVEGGGSLLGSFFKQNLLQKLHVYVGPRIIGDKGIPLFSHLTINTLNEAPTLSILETKAFNNTIRIDYGVNHANLL